MDILLLGIAVVNQTLIIVDKKIDRALVFFPKSKFRADSICGGIGACFIG